jgi:hypothetical protein
MAISRFDQPAEAQFINTHVPIPFEQMAQAAMQRQQQYEAGMDYIDEVTTQAGTYKALDTIRDPFTGQSVSTGDKQRAQAWEQKINERIEALSQQIPDASSPEFRREAKNIMGEVRKAKGPEGILGRIEQRANTYAQMMSDKRAASQLGKSAHYGYGVDKNIADFISSTQGGAAEGILDYTGTISGEVDRTKKLYDYMDKIEPETLYKHAGEHPNLEGMTLTEIREGITFETAYKAAVNQVYQDTDTIRDISQEAQYAAAEGKTDLSVDEYVKKEVAKMAARAAQVYESDKVTKLQLGRLPSEGDGSGSKTKPPSFGENLSRNTTVTYIPETLTHGEVVANIQQYETANEAIDEEIKSLVQEHNIQDDGMGIVVDDKGNQIPTDFSEKLSNLDSARTQNTMLAQQYQYVDDQVREKTGMVPGDPRYAKALNQASNLAKEDAENIYNTLARYGSQEAAQELIAFTKNPPRTGELRKAYAARMAEEIGAEEVDALRFYGAHMSNKSDALLGKVLPNTSYKGIPVDNFLMNDLPEAGESKDEYLARVSGKFDEDYLTNTKEYKSKYKKYFEQISEKYSVNVPQYQLGPDFVKDNPIIGKLSSFAANYELADTEIYDVVTGKAISELGEEEYNKLDVENAEAYTFILDPASTTGMSIMYTTPSKKDVEGEGRVLRADAPREFLPMVKAQSSTEHTAGLALTEKVRASVLGKVDKRGNIGIPVATGVDEKGNIIADDLDFAIRYPINRKDPNSVYEATVTLPTGGKREISAKTENGLISEIMGMWTIASAAGQTEIEKAKNRTSPTYK